MQRVADVESVERAIVAAVAPPRVEELRGWIAAFDHTTVGRARSAAPLSHRAIDAAAVGPIAQRYRTNGLAPMFRVPRADGLEEVEAQLRDLGLRAGQPTEVQVAPAERTARQADGAAVRLDALPDASWASVFLGEGFDAVDGSNRVRTFTRAPGSLFASIRDGDGGVLAAGVLAFGHGWASIHGMRTALAHRGRGLATHILAAMAQAALARGHERMMLQVEEANAPARKLYERCGFERAWTYLYWREPS